MKRLSSCLRHCNTPDFGGALKAELETLGIEAMDLARATTQGGYIDPQQFSVSILDIVGDARAIRVKIGVFFTELVGGCNCAEDPFQSAGYCEALIDIDRSTGDFGFQLLPD